MANMKMESCGARESTGKNMAKLRDWFMVNDPAGSSG
jgi:hypothetical protein